jgi:hypothetical protein
MAIEAWLMMIAVFAVCFGGFIYSLYLSSKED